MRSGVYWSALLVGAMACGDDEPDPFGPIVDDVSAAEGVAMCTPQGAGAEWAFARLGAGTKSALAVDASGFAHAAFVNEAIPGWVRYARLPAGADAAAELARVADGYFYGPIDLVLDPGGRPHVLYHDHDREDQVLATRLTDGQWRLDTMAHPGHDGWYNAGAFDQSGTLHTASYDPRGFNGSGVEYGVWDGSAWSVELAAPGSFDYAGGMAIAASGTSVYVAFFDDLAGVARLAERSGPGSWSVEEIEPIGIFDEVGRFPDLVLDPTADELHLAYLAVTGPEVGRIRYARGQPGALMIRDVADVDEFTIGFNGSRDLATVALDSGGDAIVAYQTWSRLAVLRVGTNATDTLGDFTAGGGVAFGQQTEVVVDASDRVHVAWWQSGEAPGTVCHAVRG